MIYFDTSYLLKCYVNEIGSSEVRELASEHSQIGCCEFGRLELFSAFHRCLRESMVSRAELEVILEQFDIDQKDQIWSWLPFDRKLMEHVVDAYEDLPGTVYLRTGDAIHLISARDHEITELYSNDTHLLSAAGTFAVKARNVIGKPA